MLQNHIYLIIFIGIILSYLMILIFPFYFIPDFFNLSNNHNISSFLVTIISSISSLTGLLIAILIIAFEYYKTNLNKIYLKYFIHNKALVYLTSSYLFVFIYTSLTLLIIKETSPYSGNEVTLSYISIFSFIALFPATFFLSYQLIKSLSINDIIEEYLNKLDFENIYLIDGNARIIHTPQKNDKASQKNDKSIEQIFENDNLEILKKLLINQLSTDNVVKSQHILNTIFQKFTSFLLSQIESEINSQLHFHQFRFANFLISLISDTRKNNLHHRLVLDCILHNTEKLYIESNKKNIPITYLESFRRYFYTKILYMQKQNFDNKMKILQSLKEVIKVNHNKLLSYEYIISPNKNSTKSELILKPNILEAKYEQVEYQLSWAELKEEYITYYTKSMNKAIERGKENNFLAILSLYNEITFINLWKKNQNENTLAFEWIVINFSFMIGIYEDALNRGVIFKISPTKLITKFQMKHLYKYNFKCAKRILDEYLLFIIRLNKSKKLTFNIYCGILEFNLSTMYEGNSLTQLGRFFAENYHLHTKFERSLEEVITTLDIIYNSILERGSYDEINLKNLERTLNSIKQSYLESRKSQNKSQKLLRRLNRFIRQITENT